MRVGRCVSLSIHAPGVGDLDVLPGGIAVTSGEDGYVRFTDLAELKELKTMRLESDDGTIPSIAVGGNDLFVATSDNYVLNRYVLGAKPKFEGCFLRCTEDIKHIACSQSYVAVVSEDTQSRVVFRANMERLLILQGHKEVVKSIAIDPLETYVATTGADNTVQIFDIAHIDDDTVEVPALKSLPLQYQSGMKNDDVLCRIAWQPGQGHLLAVPLRMNTLGLIARDSWALVHKLVFPTADGIFNSDINVVAFSPNGRYVAAASMARQIFVWSTSSQVCVSVFEVDDSVLGLAWLVDANGFAVLTAAGSVGYAANVVPDAFESGVPSATVTAAPPTAVTAPSTVVAVAAPAPVAAPVPKATEGSVIDTDDEHDMQVNAIKRSFGFGEDMTVLPPAADEVASPTLSPRAALPAHVSPLVFAKPLAPPFQSGAVLSGPVTLLAWSPLGEIERLPSTEDHLIQVTFADKNRRGFKFADSYGFVMAAFDAAGALFASPKAEDEPSVLFYRRFESWAANASWHAALPIDEDALCVATTDAFCAVATSLNVVRVYTTAGVPYGAFSLGARVLTMAAAGPYLAVITQPSRDASLEFALYVLPFSRHRPRLAVVARGPLPLTPHSELKWLGFNDAHMLFALDGAGLLHVLAHGMGGQWAPVGSPGVHVFALGFLRDSLLYIPLPEDVTVPRLARKNRPVPSTFALGTAPEFMDKSTVRLYPYYKVAHAAFEEELLGTASAGLVPDQAAMDKQLIVLFKDACTTDQPARALDLAKCLQLEKSHLIAHKVAMHFGMRQLAAQLEALYDRMFEADEVAMEAPPRPATPPPTRVRDFMPPLKQLRPVAPPPEEEAEAAADEQEEAAATAKAPVTPPPGPAPMRTNPFFKGTQDAKRKAAPGSLDTLKSPPPKKKADRLFVRKV
ncbi:hypothetical protein ACHHYP_15577 [Achlya hypogyna]|uniref:Uncharacterized protein n=1 Tax=Achlya hypogyna TaxID=1202772 RepID=A0A1V9YAJ9_ACHHY|nr:hypothetical protein ACHHYP_15577 [Achlya hypogyna]